jgi:glutaredoxin 3
LLQSLKAPSLFIIELDKDPRGSEIQDTLGQMTGQSTVPSIWISGKHIGGCDDLTALNNKGKLTAMLADVKA